MNIRRPQFASPGVRDADAQAKFTHLFLCREYPPAAYPPGGIGTYVRHITRLLAGAGDKVHVIAHRWAGAPDARVELEGGRLIIHRVALDQAAACGATHAGGKYAELVPRGLLASAFPAQAFAWQAALLAENLIGSEGIDVIEAQEWEAPLYYLQLRRDLNLGPERRPPCVVHLHSSTEQIFAANGWDTSVVDYGEAVTQERFSITRADALLAPSHFVAMQTAVRYSIDRSRIHVIPYPGGDTPRLERGQNTWSRRSLCHVGRLEPRKGVLELVEAITSIAVDFPDLMIEFIGSDTPLGVSGGHSVGEEILQRIPDRLVHQFRFHGAGDCHAVRAVLARQSVAVVPSRWENFPYSCIESMSSGLPVIASPNGGMQELIEDGVSGWIAPDATPSGLAVALRRALAATGAERARMGDSAANKAAEACGNALIVEQHRSWKSRLLRAAAPVSPDPGSRSGDPHSRENATPGLREARPDEWRIVPWEHGSNGGAALEAAERMLLAHPVAVGLVFVDSHVQLDSMAVELCRSAFEQNDRLGLLSSWIHESAPAKRIQVQPDAARPHLWKPETLSPWVAVRAQALASALGASAGPARQRSLRSAFECVLEDGWGALTYPAVLATIRIDPAHRTPGSSAGSYSSMAHALRRLHTPLLQWLSESSAVDRRRAFTQFLRNPLQTVRWVARRAFFGLRSRT